MVLDDFLVFTTHEINMVLIEAFFLFFTTEDHPQYVLNQVSLPIQSDRVCGAHNWYGSAFLPQTTFCAGYEQGGRDACIVSLAYKYTCTYM